MALNRRKPPLFPGDGRVGHPTIIPAERALRPIWNRKKELAVLAGADTGGQNTPPAP